MFMFASMTLTLSLTLKTFVRLVLVFLFFVFFTSERPATALVRLKPPPAMSNTRKSRRHTRCAWRMLGRECGYLRPLETPFWNSTTCTGPGSLPPPPTCRKWWVPLPVFFCFFVFFPFPPSTSLWGFLFRKYAFVPYIALIRPIHQRE